MNLLRRRRARALLRHGGNAVAMLDRGALAHSLVLGGIRVGIPVRFDPEQGRDLDATFELRVRDPRGRDPVPFSLRLAGGRCAVRRGPASHPQAAATLGGADIIRLAAGAVTYPELLASGRLELSGDPFLALRFPILFKLPAARAEAHR